MKRHPLIAAAAMALTVVALSPQVSLASEATVAAAAFSGAPQAVRGSRAAGRAQAAAAPMAPAAALAAAQPLLTGAGLSCQATEAKHLGRQGDNQVFEVTCASGPGYIVTAGVPPTASNCLALATIPAPADPAEASVQCTFPRNLDVLVGVTPLATAAGVPCAIDTAVWLGSTTAGHDRYEVGCSGEAGYWIEVPKTGASTVLPCLELVARAGRTCNFTTAEELAASIGSKLAGTSAPPCAVNQGRYVGSNPSGKFYEARCADGSGFMFQTNPENAFQTAYPCAIATNVAGGCTLTDTSAIFAAANERLLTLSSGAGFACERTQHRTLGNEVGGTSRVVTEFSCGNQALGVVTMAPATGSDGFEAFDCLSATGRRLTCTLTSNDLLKQALARQLEIAGTRCDIQQFQGHGRLLDQAAELFEVKCAGGAGYMATVPRNRSSAATVKTCAAAARDENRCSL